MISPKNWWSDDGVFQQGLLRFQRVLAKVLAVAMVIVIIAATLQLMTVLAWEVAPAQFPFLVSELEMVLGQVLELLIAIEVLENITAYLKDHHIQVELVLATAITALARKIIVMPEPTAAVDKPLLVISWGGVLCALRGLLAGATQQGRIRSSSADALPDPLSGSSRCCSFGWQLPSFTNGRKPKSSGCCGVAQPLNPFEPC